MAHYPVCRKHLLETMKTICIDLILLTTVVVSLTVDQEIANSRDPRAFDFFKVSSDGDIMVKTELDILMTIEGYEMLRQSARNSRGKRKAVIRTRISDLWQGSTVYYTLNDNIEEQRNLIKSAMDHYENYTCLKFEENQSAPRRIDFQAAPWCGSFVGRLIVPQGLYLAPECTSLVTLIHEMGHAIGFEHEHSRPDRDSYIRVNYNALHPVLHEQYDKITKGIHTYGIAYDYTSIMHYRGLGVITTLDPAYQDKIGNSNGLSFKDIKLVNLMYDCRSQYCPEKACPFNGFVFFKSFKEQAKCECWCDSGNVDDPLVLCSSIDKEFPEPNLRSASTLPARNLSGCIDMRHNCAYLKEQGLCRTEITMMYNMCPQTCDFCGKGSDLCMDNEDGCGMLAASGACKQGGLREMMSQLCPKSCGLCAAISAPCDIELSLMEPPRMLSDSRAVKSIRWITVLNLLVTASGFCT